MTDDNKQEWIAQAAKMEAERDILLSSLRVIEGMRGLTLIAPSLGVDGDHGHQIGANKAFGQTADIASSAIAKATRATGKSDGGQGDR